MPLEAIPVWTIPPDWSLPVTETLEWKTGVFTSLTAIEQRQSLRLSPRRALEYSVGVTGKWRTYYDALLSTENQGDFYTPLWHDSGSLVGNHPAGSGSITVRGIRTELAQATVLFILGSAPYLYDILEVASVSVASGNTIFILTGATERAWPSRTQVFAAVVGSLTAQPGFERLTDDAQRSTVRFDFIQKNDWPTVVTLPTYRSFPVVELRTNEGKSQGGSYFRNRSAIDNDVGLPVRRDFAGLGFPTFTGTDFVNGLSDTNGLRSLLYTLRGRRNPAWFVYPTSDFTLMRTVSADATSLVVERSGFTDLGGPVEGRQDICIRLRDGAVFYRRITGSVINVDGETETLNLDAALGDIVWPEYISRISFIGLGRLDQDMITLTHHTDSEGVCEVSLAFKLLPGVREADDWFPPPLPLSNFGECGVTQGTFWARLNDGPWNGDAGINPSLGGGGVDITDIDGVLFPVAGFNTGFFGGQITEVNFGGTPFDFTVPSGAAAWNVTATWNPADKSASVNLSEGNLTAQVGGLQTAKYVRATTNTGTQSGLRYFEFRIVTKAQNNYIGFCNGSFEVDQPSLGGGGGLGSVLVADDGEIHLNGVGTGVSVGAGTVNGDTICLLIYSGTPG